MEQGKIVVVMGGPSSEAEVSRRTGAAVVKALQEKGWQAEGLELEPATFAETIKNSGCRAVFNAVHGKYGEDGRLQAMLEMLGIPYTGSGVLASALTIDKAAIKNTFLGAGIPTPRSRTYLKYEQSRDLATEILGEFNLPVVVKAASQGSSIGVVIVEKAEELGKALTECFGYDEEVLIEEFIRGKELTVAVMGNPEKQEAMPIIEITTNSGRYDYESKYTVGASQHIIPARLTEAEAELVRKAALDTFRVCGCRGVARIDVMLSEQDVPNVIDVNTVPGMTETSLVPDAARAMGLSFPELCDRLLRQVLA